MSVLLIPAIQLTAGSSLWLIPLCLLFGAGISALLYFKNTSGDLPRNLLLFLSVVRFLTGSFIAFLLLSPMVKTFTRSVEKPALIIGIDNSRSMVAGADSMLKQQELQQFLDELKAGIDDRFEVYTYSFGQEVREENIPSFKDELTDISSFFRELSSRFHNRNVGAVVLVSDGIWNSGSDPLYLSGNADFPVYTYNAGDTIVRRDLILKEINYNRVSYLGNRFPIEVVVHGREAAGSQSRLSVEAGGKEVFTKVLQFSSDNQVITVPVFADASEMGFIKFRISLGTIEGETNTSNNVREVFVDVRKGRKKIALIAAAPHPDLAAVLRSVNAGNNFEASLFMADNFRENPGDFDLFILHQVPSRDAPRQTLSSELVQLGKPVLFILGSQSDIPSFNRLKTGLALVNANASANEALPVYDKNFSLFVVSDPVIKMLGEVPPLISPFASYQSAGSVYVMAWQGLGSLQSNNPLIMFSQLSDTRYGIVAGEGLWKWRISEYSRSSSHDAFDELAGKIIQYLSVEPDRNRLKISWRDTYAENESVEFNALLLNESGELVNDPLLEMKILDDRNNDFGFSFTTAGDGYYLNAGTLSPGYYRFAATAETGSGRQERNGSFVVSDLHLEDINTVANHRLLNAIALRTGGASVYPAQAEILTGLINDREDAKPVIYARKKYTDLVNFAPLLVLIVLLAGVEWFLRRYYGSY